MERPKPEEQPPIDQHDHELSPTNASFIALADALLEHKEADSPLTFVDIIVQADTAATYKRLEQTRVGRLLLKPGDQLALESDGQYYPVVDAPKPDGPPQSIGVTVWGWDHEKVRYTGNEEPQGSYPRDFVRYDGQQDHTRQIDIRIHHQVGQIRATETVGLYGSTSRTSLPSGSRKVTMSEYAETGYEGHNNVHTYDLTDDDVVGFMELVADIVGDEPMSTSELRDKQYNEYLQRIVSPDSLAYIEEWVDNSWNGQVMADLARKELRVGDTPMYQALTMPELAEQAQDTLANYIDYLRLQTNQRAVEHSDNVALAQYAKPWRDGPNRQA